MNTRYFLFIALVVVILSACSRAGGNKTGHEFMPDMVHPVGYEANYYDYYYFNRWGSEAEYKKVASPRLPVKNTIARGFAGGASNDPGVSTPNGYVPYYYGDTEDERTRASNELKLNPYPISEKNITEGKKLFDINCAICHGVKGDGAGYLVRDDGGKYPVAPANFLLDTFYKSNNGRFYHAIMYGKNMMGSYADKLSYKERWQVIQYIRSLQAKAKNLQYDQSDNTLNDVDIPQSKWVANIPVEENLKNNEIPSMELKHSSLHKVETPKH